MSGARRGGFPLSYFFASFFGAVLVAGAFAYYNYKFSQYKFFSFDDMVFYTKTDSFTPQDEHYSLLIYSSNMSDLEKLLEQIEKKHKILTLDMYQKRDGVEGVDMIAISGGTNTLLRFIQRMDLYEVPALVKIKRVKNNEYKQDSPIYILDNNKGK